MAASAVAKNFVRARNPRFAPARIAIISSTAPIPAQRTTSKTSSGSSGRCAPASAASNTMTKTMPPIVGVPVFVR